ncbi:MAG: hypothetical protein ACRD1X_01625 [Vicinamibacteria bacterium]
MAKKRDSLRDDHLEALNRCLKSCAETGEFLQRCKSCFIDVDQEIQRNDEQKKIAEAIKAQFFPTRV